MGIFTRKPKPEIESSSPAQTFATSSNRNSAYQYQTGPGGYFRGLRESSNIAAQAAKTYPVLGIPAGVQIIGLLEQAVAGLPVIVKNVRSGKPVTPPPAWILRPGGTEYPEITFPIILKHIVSSVLLDGIAYATVKRNKQGEIIQICPLDPTSVYERVNSNGRRKFVIRSSHIGGVRYSPAFWGYRAGQQIGIEDMMIWSGGITIPGVSRSVSPFDLVRDIIDIALSSQKFARHHYEFNAGKPTVMTVSDQVVGKDKKDQQNFIEELEDDFEGQDRESFKLLIAPGKPSDHVQIETPGPTPAESDTTSIQQFAMSQIAMVLGIPLDLIGGTNQTGGSAYNSLHVKKAHCQSQVIEPLSRMVCDGFQRFLPANLELGLDCGTLSQGDLQTMAIIADRAVRIGLLTLDEGRELIGKEPLPENQGNIIMVDNARKTLDQVLEPEPEPEPQPMLPEESPETTGRPTEGV